jgi:tRNA pseudouridine38-40 synthase
VVGSNEVPEKVDFERLRSALNGMCGPALAVSNCREMDSDWHARFSARSRTYVYAILESDTPDPFLAPTTLRSASRLDLDAMNEAAGSLVGHHDFSSFGRVSDEEKSAERTLFELHARRTANVICIRARADSFIQQMVRSLVGTLLEVGEGRRSPDEMHEILNARERHRAGAVAPPHGLCLVSVEYDEGWSVPVDPFHDGRYSPGSSAVPSIDGQEKV